METTGKHWQVPMPFLAEVRARQADPVHIAAMADTGAVRYAIQSSGHDDYEVAEVLGISPGYMSKVLHGTAGLYGKRLVRFMQITGSVAVAGRADGLRCGAALVAGRTHRRAGAGIG